MDTNLEIINKYNKEMILASKKLPEDIKLLAEQERKRIDLESKNGKYWKYWKKMPNSLKYFGIASVFTWEDFVRYFEERERMRSGPIFPDTRHNAHSHGIVNTEGQIGSLDPIPNADWPLRKGSKIYPY